jgi:2-hydroxy-3-keto-5-methylthiopentenyl-1-phosphate phosphatase
MKQFVKALDENGQYFKYLCTKFTDLSNAKLKEVIFIRPQIRSLCKGTDFQNSMNVVERNAWTAFKSVIEKLLGNHKDEDYENIVRIMFKYFHILGCM